MRGVLRRNQRQTTLSQCCFVIMSNEICMFFGLSIILLIYGLSDINQAIVCILQVWAIQIDGFSHFLIYQPSVESGDQQHEEFLPQCNHDGQNEHTPTLASSGKYYRCFWHHVTNMQSRRIPNVARFGVWLNFV